MVPTLTIFGRFSEAARGAVIPWLETTLVTVAIMAVPSAEVTSIPPRYLYSFLMLYPVNVQREYVKNFIFPIGNFSPCFTTPH